MTPPETVHLTIPPPPPSAPTPPTALQYGRSLITEAARIRRETDDVMSSLWILSPLLGFVLFIGILVGSLFLGRSATPGTTTGLFAGAIVGFIAAAVVAIILFVLPWYKLIKRRNGHFRRDRKQIKRVPTRDRERVLAAYREDILISAGSDSAAEPGAIDDSESNSDEEEKSAALWIILTIVFFPLGIYVLYFLTKDPHNHDVRQLAFMQQVQSSFSKLEKTVVFPFWKSVPSRSFFLYLVLTWFTSLFFLYWNYVLITDFNNHFKAQWQVEDQLLANL